MAHFAQIDSNNIVTQVAVVHNNHALSGQELLNELGFLGTWIQTSYNSRGGIHYTNVLTDNGYILSADSLSHLRYNFAQPGYTYDSIRDAFIAPCPYKGWIINESTCEWEAPIPYPATGYGIGTLLTAPNHEWDEVNLTWSPMSAMPSLSAYYFEELANNS